MRCSRLLMQLTRPLNPAARNSISIVVKPVQGKELKTDEERKKGEKRFEQETKSKMNAQQQITALLSFKEAVCTGE
jgi:hypothetical protein